MIISIGRFQIQCTRKNDVPDFEVFDDPEIKKKR